MPGYVLKGMDKNDPERSGLRISETKSNENEALMESVGVTGFPTLLFMHDGKEIPRWKARSKNRPSSPRPTRARPAEAVHSRSLGRTPAERLAGLRGREDASPFYSMMVYLPGFLGFSRG